MPTSEEAAATAAASAIAGEDGDEAQETESGAEGTTEEETVPTWRMSLSEEDLAELEDDEEDITVSEDELDDLSQQHEDAPREVLARMRAAEKRAEHLEKLRVTDAKKNWSAEASKKFPLAEPFLGEITATSRRAYLRTAKDLQVRMEPLVDKLMASRVADAEKAKSDAIEEGKKEARDAWGKPIVKDDMPSEATATLVATQDRRRRGEFSDTVRNMIFPKETNGSQ